MNYFLKYELPSTAEFQSTTLALGMGHVVQTKSPHIPMRHYIKPCKTIQTLNATKPYKTLRKAYNTLLEYLTGCIITSNFFLCLWVFSCPSLARTSAFSPVASHKWHVEENLVIQKHTDREERRTMQRRPLRVPSQGEQSLAS